MTIPQKPEAEALRIGMLAGLFARADAVRWADRLIDELDKPCSELIDLSTSEGLDRSSFAALLASIPGEADPALTRRILLGRARRKLAQGGELAAVLPSLAQLAELVELTGEEKQAVARLTSGVPGEPLRQEATSFLAAYELKGETRLLE